MTPEEILARCVPNRIVTPFVERYGLLFEPSPLPKWFRSGNLRACFANSYRMALRHGFTYVEGYAVSADGHGHLHAWCADDKRRVLDRTWRPGLGYFGIPFQTTYLRTVIRERKRRGDEYYGLLDDWERQHPLITLHSDSPELWLAPIGEK